MHAPSQFHFSHRRLVEFADTDLAGIMHFANFFRFVEGAEHAYFRSLGFPVHTVDGAQHHGWPRVEASCRYHQPARFEQTLEVALRVDEVRTSSLRYSFWIFVADDPARAVLATGSLSLVHVAFDAHTRQLQKAPIPAALRARLDAAVGPRPTAAG